MVLSLWSFIEDSRSSSQSSLLVFSFTPGSFMSHGGFLVPPLWLLSIKSAVCGCCLSWVFSFFWCLLGLSATVHKPSLCSCFFSVHHIFLILRCTSSLDVLMFLKLGCVLPIGKGLRSDEDDHRLCVNRLLSISYLSCYGHLFHWRHLNFAFGFLNYCLLCILKDYTIMK